MDAVCKKAGMWPHAAQPAHARNCQRLTRTAGDGATAKTPDDSVAVDLATRRIAHFNG